MSKQYDFSGKQILLAEDNRINVEVVKRLLMRHGAEVTVANNGLEAIEIFSKEPVNFFAAIIMDIRMPIMDGITSATHIRQLQKQDGRTVPIIALSANAFAEDVERSLSSGMNAHLAKPVEPQELYRVLDSFINK